MLRTQDRTEEFSPDYLLLVTNDADPGKLRDTDRTVVGRQFCNGGDMDRAADTLDCSNVQYVCTGVSSGWEVSRLDGTNHSNSGRVRIPPQAFPIAVAQTATSIEMLAVQVTSHDYPSECPQNDV